jgi:hypothetical protein
MLCSHSYPQLAPNPTTLLNAYIEPHPHRNYVAQWNLYLLHWPGGTSLILDTGLGDSVRAYANKSSDLRCTFCEEMD